MATDFSFSAPTTSEPQTRNDGWGSTTSQSAPAPAAQPVAALPDLAKTPKWRDIAAGSKFKALPADERTKLKEAYFDDFIAPHAGADAPRAKQEFLAKDFGEGAAQPDERSTLEAVGDAARDVTAATLKIGPTAVKGVADIYDMAVGNEESNAVSRSMERGMESIDDTVGSDHMKQQRLGFQAVMEDDEKGIGDMFSYLLDNPGLLVNESITTLGSMYLPGGAAKAAGMATKALGFTNATTVKAALATVMATTAAQNAADTFKSLEGQSLDDRYNGAKVSAAISMLTAIATGGGAEGQVATRLVQDLKSGRAGVEAVKHFFQSVSRETLQEMGEEAGNVAGEIYGNGDVPSPDAIAKRVSFAGALGGMVGGGTDLALNALDGGAPRPAPGAAPGQGTPVPPAGPAPAAPELLQEHPSVQASEDVLREMAAEAGVPEDVVMPDRSGLRTVQPGESIPVEPAPVYSSMEEIPDDALIEFAQSRRDQLRQKRDGMIDVVQTDEGLVDQQIPGAGLSDVEAMELELLESNGHNGRALRSFYAFDTEQTVADMIGGPSGPEPVDSSDPRQRYNLNPVGTARVLPRDLVAEDGDGADSPWLMNDGAMIGTGQDHIDSFIDGDKTYSDFMRRTGAVRSAFFKDTSGVYVAMLHTAPGQRLNSEQVETVRQLIEAQDGPTAVYVGESEDSNPEYRKVELNELIAAEAAGDTLYRIPPAPADISAKANEAATSPTNDLPEPTVAQQEAGNYKKGHLKYEGLDLTIENPIGSVRSGKDPGGNEWSVPMTAHYGYIKRTMGADGDQVDVYLAGEPKPESPVFIVYQSNDDGSFDEHKVVLGVQTEAEAKTVYDAHFSDGSGPRRRSAIKKVTSTQLKHWLANEEPSKPSEAEKVAPQQAEPAPRAKPLTEKQRNQEKDYAGKWFGSQGAADTFINSKRISETHEAVQDGRRFEIRRKAPVVAPEPAAAPEAASKPQPDFRQPAPIVVDAFDVGTGIVTVTARESFSPGSYKNVYGTAGGILSFELNGPGLDSENAFKSIAGVTYAGEMNPARLREMMEKLARDNAKTGTAEPPVQNALQSEPSQPAASPEEGAPDARTVQPDDVSARSQEQALGDGAAPARDSEPLDAGLAGTSERAAGVGAVSDLPEGTDAPGAGSTEPAGPGSPLGVGENGSDGAGSVATVPADVEQQPRSERAKRSRSKAGRNEPDLFGDAGAAGERAPGAVVGDELDHVIDADAIGKGGLTQKYRDNVAAIRLLKSLEAEQRPATPEERKTLAKYVGWGAMKGPFDPASKQWESQHAELKELLTEQEFAAARRSTLDAHFTSPIAIKAMYDALRRLGFTGGRLLEPSVGVGNFLGLMPADMRRNTQVHGVELDSLTSRMVAALYPSAKIAKATGFQDFDIPAEFFDVAIGNPPFGNQPLVDMERSEYSGFSIHNYFLAKSIDKLRPGGLMPIVVSHYFLDAQDSRARDWIGERANLIGAVRLPNTAFRENAGTEVVTDILIFQKKGGEFVADDVGPWRGVKLQQNLNPKTGDYADHRVSELFVDQPDLVLGKPMASGSMYSADEYTVEQTGDIGELLAEWVKTLPSQVFTNINRSSDRAQVDMAIPDGLKVGSFYIEKSGQIKQRDADVMGDKRAIPWTPPNQTAVDRMKGMIELRDLLRAQMRMERDVDAAAAAIEKNRTALKAAYDNFLKRFGYLNSSTNRRVFFDDTESPLVLALEFDYDPGISKATAEREGIEPKEPRAVPADILTRRVAFPPQDFFAVTTAKDALLASLNYRGRLDTTYMEEVYGQPIDKIVTELGDLVYQDPERGYVTADDYLSGDVKTKLQEAQLAAAGDAAYQRNVAALEKVIPKDKKPSEIAVSVGASFVPAELYEQFAQHVTGSKPSMFYISATGQWVANFSAPGDPALNVGRFGTEKLDAKALFNLLLLGKGAVVKETVRHPGGGTTTIVLEKETEAAREKQNVIKAEWQKWLWSDPARAERLAGLYNEKMNRIVVREFNGDHMTFPGMNPAITLLRHQKNGVWRGLQSFQVLYDHVVGAGKTFEMAALAMEMKRLGVSRKPLFAVPNHLTLQWRSEINRLYPGARVLAAVPSDFSKENREKFFSKIITGDWDAVVIGHSSLKRIGLPAHTEQAVLEEQVSEIGAALEAIKRDRGDRNIIRDMEKIKANLQAKMKERLAAIGKRSNVVTFDELGMDALFVDEMHEFKNLAYLSTMDRTPGMGNPAGSAKAFDLFVKVRWLFDTFGEKAPMISATGTPVSNSLVEMYNMQRYMQYPMLKQLGLHVFDAWAKQFGNIENVYEVAPSGSGYRQSTRFSKFTNLPALMGLYNTFADTVTLDDLKAQEVALGRTFPVPKLVGGKPMNIVAQRSPAVAEFMGVPRAELDDDGNVVFDIDPEKAEIALMTDGGGKWFLKGERVYFGNLETEQDATLKLVEMSVTPRVAPRPESILGQFANLRALTKETKGKINALSLTNLANKAGLDYRLIDPAAADFPGSKINLAVDRMWEIHQQWAADRGAQLVFCDMSIPNSARSSYANKPHKLYVRGAGEQLEIKSGTMHVVPNYEYLPFFVVKRGTKEEARFSVYDAKSGQLVGDDFRSKDLAIEDVKTRLESEAGLAAWTLMRNTGIDINQDEIDEHNNENGIELTETSGYLMMDDVEGAASSGKFSVYDDIKEKLVRKGIPEAEVAFIHDYNTPVAKEKLFKAVKEGRVRILLGSTPKMGAGTNVQDRLVGLHHIDAPWRPSDLEQREGRIIRRGNKLYARDPDGFEVFIGRYATEQTYDTRRWQILEHKARGIEQLRNYDGTTNEIDDIEGEAANAADMKAAASGDPLILEETKLRNEVRRLERLQVSHADEVLAMTYRARSAKEFAEKTGPEWLAVVESMAKTAAAHPSDDKGWASPKVMMYKHADDKDAVYKALSNAFDKAKDNTYGAMTITFRGLTFALEHIGRGDVAIRLPDRQGTHSIYGKGDSFSPTGFVQRLKNWVDGLPSSAEGLKAKISKSLEDHAALTAQAKEPFAQESELEEARQQHQAVRRALMAKGPEVPPEQKELVQSAIESRKSKLRELGHGEAVDELFRAGNNGRSFREPADREYGDPYRNIPTRPGTTEGQRREGRNGLKALFRRLGQPPAPGRATDSPVGEGYRVLGRRLAADVSAGRVGSLVGAVVASPDDLAVLAQIYRDPRFETFRVIYMDGNRIAGEAGYSSRLPASVAEPPHLLAHIAAGKSRYRADGYYLIHNHPSGKATPSSDDERATRAIASAARGFRGHVVIDFNEYAVIQRTGPSRVVNAPELGSIDFTSSPSHPHPILGRTVKSAMDVARIGKEVQVAGAHATLVMLDAGAKVQLIVDVPMGVLGDTSRKGLTIGKAAIRKMARDSGSGGNRFLVLPAGIGVDAFHPWVDAGVFKDVVAADGGSALHNNPERSVKDFMEEGPSRSVSEGRPEASFFEDTQKSYTTDDSFAQWFVDSKVVDAKGEPLVVYHATTKDFAEFKVQSKGFELGFHFGTEAAAEQRLRDTATLKSGDYRKGSRVLPVYLSIRNPLRLPDPGNFSPYRLLVSAEDNDGNFKLLPGPLLQAGIITQEQAEAVRLAMREPGDYYETQAREMLVNMIETKGYDGIVYTNEHEDKGQDSYVVFHPDQIRSAIGNGAQSRNILREPVDDEYDAGESIGRRAQRSLLDWMQRTPDNLSTFGFYDKTIATQYHKALKDRHYAQVFSLSLALQNEISMISIRPAEKAPGLLPKVDNVRAAAAQLVHGRKGGDTVTKVAHAVFAGTLAGENVMDGTVWTDPQLRAKFGLDDTGVALYHQARAAIDTSLEELAAAEAFATARGYVPASVRARIISNPGKARSILETALDKQAAVLEAALNNAIRGGNDYMIESLTYAKTQYDKTRDRVDAIFTTVDNLTEAGYAPLMRFGKYSVTVQEIDPDTGATALTADGKPIIVFHSKYETEGEAKAAARRFEKLYADQPEMMIRAGTDSELGHELYSGISPETIALFGQTTGVDLQEYYRLALAERSALKRRIERSGTPGYNRDLPRVLANFITSNARHAARQYYLQDINNAIKKIPQKKGDVKDEAIKLKKFMLDPADRGASASSIMFVWFLGGAIDSAIVNITQPYVATFPHLVQFTTVKKAWKAMSDALPFALGSKEISDKTLRDALIRAGQEGIVDAQEVFHLYSIGSQNVSAMMANALSNLPGIGKKIKDKEEDVRARVSAFLAIWGSMFAAAEKFNRRLTFISAWNVAKSKNERNPYAFAVRAVNETQGIYNKVNRPNLARSGPGRVILTFKQFTIFMMEKLVRQGLKHGPEGRRAMKLFLAILMLAAGEEGLPFMQDVNDLIDTIGQLLGYNTNMVRTKRRTAHALLGDTLGDVALYGVSSMLPLDFHGRIGFGNLIPGTGMLKPSSEDLRAGEVADVFGPAVGIAEQVVDAYDAASDGNQLQALMNLSPRAVKNLAAGLDMAVSGYARDTRGRRTVDVGLADALVKMAGFTPSVVAENSRRTGPIYQDIALQKKTETAIIDEWARGAIASDNDMVTNAQERLSDWNSSNPETPIVITPAQIKGRVETLTSGKDERIFRQTPREMRGEVGLDLVE